MVQLPQRRRPHEDDVSDVTSVRALGLRRRAVRALTDGRARPREAALRGDGERSVAPTTGRASGGLVRSFDAAGRAAGSAFDLRGAPLAPRRVVLGGLPSAVDESTAMLASRSRWPGEDLDDPLTWLRQPSHARRGDLRALPGEGAPKGRAATRDHRDPLETAARSRPHTAPLTDDGVGQGILAVVNRGPLRRTTLTIWGIEHTPKHNRAASSPERREARGTLHGMNDQQRIALVETRTVTTTGTTTTVHGHAPAPLVRFQLGDLLASACVELDGIFAELSYPERHRYGTTAWWAEDGALEVSKRYRFTGMERDEETGLQVHSQRYDCPWLGRWDRPDPIGLGDGGNRWAVVKERVTTGRDESGLAVVPTTPRLPAQASPEVIADGQHGPAAASGTTVAWGSDAAKKVIAHQRSQGQPMSDAAWHAKLASMVTERGTVVFSGPGGTTTITGIHKGKALTNRSLSDLEMESLTGKNYSGEDTLLGTAITVGIEFAPLGVALDVRDASIALAQRDPVAVGVAAASLVPLVGATIRGGKKVANIVENADKVGAVTSSGGTYAMIRGAGPGGHVHHMPMKSALKAANHPLGAGSKAPHGPPIKMEGDYHRELPSSGWGSAAVSAAQAAVIRPGPGGLDEAFLMAVDEVQAVFGSKYDEAILEAMDFLP